MDNEYSVFELLEQLKTDDSIEIDTEERAMLIEMMTMMLSY